MSDLSEQEQLERLCRKLGSGPEQARAMAAQLLKRADQLALQRKIPRPEAMAYLLELLVKGRNGEAPPGFEATAPPRS